jgi:sterol desaturase/sphingolipid hydroxylase (fatty acid hydroxylase superfamily)
VEPITDRVAIRTDVLYTVIHRLGLFRCVLFFTIDPWVDDRLGEMRTAGFGTFHLEDVWPGVTDGPWTSFLIYLVVFDFLNYWLHRAQHQFNPWWALHAVHHSQRQMTQWTDNRNHLLDDVLHALIWVMVAQVIGIAPSQFVAVVALTQLSESFQHANLRVSFGWWGERLWVSPRFHRTHHGVGIGHETHGAHSLGGHNFGVLLPWWDMLFGTADFGPRFEPTGIRDQVEEGRDYGQGFWAQQRLGLKRFFSAWGTSSGL